MITRYEITATKGDKAIFIAFTARHTRQSLLWNLSNSADKIIAELGTDPDARVLKANVPYGVQLSDGTVLKFSGRTEYEIKNKA